MRVAGFEGNGTKVEVVKEYVRSIEGGYETWRVNVERLDGPPYTRLFGTLEEAMSFFRGSSFGLVEVDE